MICRFGTHPNGPADIVVGDTEQPLQAWLAVRTACALHEGAPTQGLCTNAAPLCG